MNEIDWLGYIGGVLTTFAFVPQVVQVVKRRSARDVSLAMYAIFVSGVVCWLLYGLFIGAWPIIIANLVTFCLAGAVLALKLFFDYQGS